MQRNLAFRQRNQSERSESQSDETEVQVNFNEFGLSVRFDDTTRFSTHFEADENHQIPSYKHVKSSVCTSFASQVESLYHSESTLLSSKGVVFKEKTENDLNSLKFETAQELSDRPKNGEIYKEVSANVRKIMERLAYLSKVEKSFTIDEAIEIADAAQVLKMLSRPEVDITNVVLAGKMTNEGALMIFEAEKQIQKGRNLLDRGKLLLQLANLKPDSSDPPIRKLKTL